MSVSPDRLRDLTLELVEVESPTGDTAEVARLYAKRLEEIGMQVEVLDERFPRTPIVIGRLQGDRPGPTIVLLSLFGFAVTWPLGVWLRRRARLTAPFATGIPDGHEASSTHPHQHGPDCGHVAVEHDDHVDYVHDGHRHAVHVTGEGPHYDEH